MRNPFDQYTQPENKVTHALAVALDRDRALLGKFLRLFDEKPPHPAAQLLVVCQQLPGDPYPLQTDAEIERRGLPDICIVDEASGWAFAVECKVTAGFEIDQCRRHARTLRGRGFQTVDIGVISLARPARLDTTWRWRSWIEVHRLLTNEGESAVSWPAEAARYIEVFEDRMTVERDFEGAMTAFSGFRFREGYSYPEAKRMLRLVMQELQRRPKLGEIGIDLTAKGRGSITGAKSDAVWDYLRIGTEGAKSHTSAPHLTVSIRESDVCIDITLPHRIGSKYRKRMGKRGEHLKAAILRAEAEITRCANLLGGRPNIRIMQRRYRNERDPQPFVDALINFDLRTAKESPSSPGPKTAAVWLDAALSGFISRRANIQLQIGASIPYGSARMASARAIDGIEKIAMALGPVTNLLLKDS